MTDGTLSVRRRDPKATELSAEEAKQTAISAGSYEYFADMENIFGKGYVKAKGKDKAPVVGPADEFKVEGRRKEKLRDFEKFLKAFKYTAALDAGLQKVSKAARSLLRFHTADLDLLGRSTFGHFRSDTGADTAGWAASRLVWSRRCDIGAHTVVRHEARYGSQIWRDGQRRRRSHHR